MIKISIENFRMIFSHVGNMAEVLKVKRLPGRYYDEVRDAWIVPIRPGLSKVLAEVYGETVAEPVRVREAYIMRMYEPPAPGTVDPSQVTAAQAVELAVMWHLYDYHKGNRAEYDRIHYPYKIGE